MGCSTTGVAEATAFAGAEVDHAVGEAGFFQNLEELCRDGRRVARGLQDDGVAADNGGQRHAAHDGAGKVPRRNYHAYAQRDVAQPIALARQLHRRLSLREANRLQRIEVAEVNQLGDVAIGFSPVLADLEHHPRHQLKLTLAHQRAGAEQQPGALFNRGILPGLECLQRRLHCGLDLSSAGCLMDANNLRRLGRIERGRLLGGLDVASADDQVVLATQFVADSFNGSAHAARVVRVAEVK